MRYGYLLSVIGYPNFKATKRHFSATEIAIRKRRMRVDRHPHRQVATNKQWGDYTLSD